MDLLPLIVLVSGIWHIVLLESSIEPTLFLTLFKTISLNSVSSLDCSWQFFVFFFDIILFSLFTNSEIPFV